jgi:hypothetical protein
MSTTGTPAQFCITKWNRLAAVRSTPPKPRICVTAISCCCPSPPVK